MKPVFSPTRLLCALAALASATPLAAQTPTPAVINPPGGGAIINATPPLAPLPAVVNPPNGGTIVNTTPTPTPAPVSIGAAAAVTHERRLIRDIQQNTDNIKSKGNFGAQLWLITDGDFFLNWAQA